MTTCRWSVGVVFALVLGYVGGVLSVSPIKTVQAYGVQLDFERKARAEAEAVLEKERAAMSAEFAATITRQAAELRESHDQDVATCMERVAGLETVITRYGLRPVLTR